MHSWKIARVKEKYMSGIYWGIYAEYCATTIRWSLGGSAAMIDSAGGASWSGLHKMGVCGVRILDKLCVWESGTDTEYP